jgi:hypothetical protein
MPPETLLITRAEFDRLHREIAYWKGCADRRGVALKMANTRADRITAERNRLQQQLMAFVGKRGAA